MLWCRVFENKVELPLKKIYSFIDDIAKGGTCIVQLERLRMIETDLVWSSELTFKIFT